MNSQDVQIDRGNQPARRRVVILGGGFGGIYAARRLERTLAKRPDVEVVLISRENYLLFTPMLHEVAAGDLDAPDIVHPLRKMVRRVRLVAAEVTEIDVQAQLVRYAVGPLRQPRELVYDYLLLALGSETNYLGMKDVEAQATTMKTLTDAALLRNRMVALLEEAAQEINPTRRRQLLTLVVAGGGFAGVETVGAINDFLRETVRYYPELDQSMLRVVLVHPGKVVLPELGERLGGYAQEKLQRRGVDMRLETRVTGYDGNAVKFDRGDTIEAMSLVWTAGAMPAAALAPLPVEKVKGRVRVNEFLEVTGHEGVVWAIGDCAAVPDGNDGFHPPTAQHGVRQAAVAARNIAATITGDASTPFIFSTIGQLASIGHRTGVAQILGVRFSGFVAWWMWRTIYLAKLPGMFLKLRVTLKWSLDLLFPREIGQFVTLRDVEYAEKLGATLRTMRGTAAPSPLSAPSRSPDGGAPVLARASDGRHPDSEKDVWWGPVNIPLEPAAFAINRERARDYLNTRERLYCFDGFAGWDPKYRMKIRVICSRPYHALFMHTMLIRPSRDELAQFGRPDFVIYNAGAFPANRLTTGVGSKTSIDLSLEDRELIILGSEYAGEMKKGVFTVANYFAPKLGLLSMHCSATAEKTSGRSSLLFGLSGTGKTTLSADPKRHLIGDDEHCWSDEGIFNIEGGCYAKAINLAPENEPDIFSALRFGAVLENVVLDAEDGSVHFTDSRITENTRGAYPVDFIRNARIPCVAGHPTDLIFLTCDAFGVLPPVSRLSAAKAMYHFISGYTAKVAGTEVGVKEPMATFSPCFGGPFLVWHPSKYAELLAAKMSRHDARVWLVNTGWSGGAFGTGKRIPLAHTRAIIDAIHAGTLSDAPAQRDPTFGFQIVSECPGVPSHILTPRSAWANPRDYDAAAKRLAELFRSNFRNYEAGCTAEIRAASPAAA